MQHLPFHCCRVDPLSIHQKELEERQGQQHRWRPLWFRLRPPRAVSCALYLDSPPSTCFCSRYCLILYPFYYQMRMNSFRFLQIQVPDCYYFHFLAAFCYYYYWCDYSVDYERSAFHPSVLSFVFGCGCGSPLLHRPDSGRGGTCTEAQSEPLPRSPELVDSFSARAARRIS